MTNNKSDFRSEKIRDALDMVEFYLSDQEEIDENIYAGYSELLSIEGYINTVPSSKKNTLKSARPRRAKFLKLTPIADTVSTNFQAFQLLYIYHHHSDQAIQNTLYVRKAWTQHAVDIYIRFSFEINKYQEKYKPLFFERGLHKNFGCDETDSDDANGGGHEMDIDDTSCKI